MNEQNSIIEATDIHAEASSFHIVRLDEDSYFSIVYEVTHENDPHLKKTIEEECGTHKPALSFYLSVPVNWRGRSHKKEPLQIKMSGRRFLTRMALQNRRSKHFRPEKLTDWLNQREIFFIHCSKHSTSGSRTRGSYLCIYKNKKLPETSSLDHDCCSSDKDPEAQLQQIVKPSQKDDNGRDEPKQHKEDDSSAVRKQPYFLGCEPNIKKHNDPNTFMLFRLLKPDKQHQGK